MDDPSYFLFGVMILFIVVIASVRIYTVWLTGQYRIVPKWSGWFDVQKFDGYQWENVYTDITDEEKAERLIRNAIKLDEEKRKFNENSRPRRVPPYRFL